MAKRSKPYPEITRLRLNAGKAIENLEWAETKLKTELPVLDLNELNGLRTYMQSQQWRINKVLPELKAVELSGTVTQEVIVKFDP